MKFLNKYGFTVIFFRKDYMSEDVGVNVGVNSTQLKILELICEKPNITQVEIAQILEITTRTIERNILALKNKNILKRVGTDKVGCWEINTDLDIS